MLLLMSSLLLVDLYTKCHHYALLWAPVHCVYVRTCVCVWFIYGDKLAVLLAVTTRSSAFCSSTHVCCSNNTLGLFPRSFCLLSSQIRLSVSFFLVCECRKQTTVRPFRRGFFPLFPNFLYLRFSSPLPFIKHPRVCLPCVSNTY
ncbi:uncharacterized protein DEA37_0007701 [Paragonimus westermani]|uniref:Uncharacterized protein n=1 Tax=Paragonimus westermani TaxID=34504 RepID=A0A5J4NBL8_9TREM|nr:uncharacterized protein DEA37_0007701 [Paragonimus westermani]